MTLFYYSTDKSSKLHLKYLLLGPCKNSVFIVVVSVLQTQMTQFHCVLSCPLSLSCSLKWLIGCPWEKIWSDIYWHKTHSTSQLKCLLDFYYKCICPPQKGDAKTVQAWGKNNLGIQKHTDTHHLKVSVIEKFDFQISPYDINRHITIQCHTWSSDEVNVRVRCWW